MKPGEFLIFSKALRLFRTEMGLTQSEFGHKIDISKARICSYESGRSLPSLETLDRIIFFARNSGFNYTYDHFLIDKKNQIHLLDDYQEIEKITKMLNDYKDRKNAELLLGNEK